MKAPLAIVATLALAALLIAGCGGDDDESDQDAAPTAAGGEESSATATEPAPGAGSDAAGTTVKTADSEFGTILFDDSDQAIYLFDKESSAKSECYGECAEAWPPVTTQGQPQAGSGVKAGLLGTSQRRDGTTQVTYNGHPLYYYHEDPPGEVLCHNVDEFGGLWLVVDPAGEAVR
jgi:predicted lipoprotein with Yx(FWY)xxD motif